MIYETSLKHLRSKRTGTKHGDKNVTALEVQQHLFNAHLADKEFRFSSCYPCAKLVKHKINIEQEATFDEDCLHLTFLIGLLVCTGFLAGGIGKIGGNCGNISFISCKGILNSFLFLISESNVVPYLLIHIKYERQYITFTNNKNI